jgi:hypothetical protein
MKGKKVCKSCQKMCGPRTITCECGYNFFEGVIKKVQEKISGERGKKICPSCELVVAAKLYKCNCGYNFKTKTLESNEEYVPEPVVEEYEDWRNLKTGDVFEVLGGGDYYISDGNKINLTQTGSYEVMKIQSNGIIAYGNSGTSFIGMEEGISKNFPCIIKEKHLIQKRK